MASKIKSRAKKPPLSTVDKLIYYFIYLMAFILLLSYLYFISFIAEKVAYSDVDIIAFNNDFIYLSSLPLILLLTCSVVVIVTLGLNKQPIFGNKKFKAKYNEYTIKVYPVFSDGFKDRYIKKNKKQLKVIAKIFFSILLVSILILPFGVCSREVITKDNQFLSVNSFNRISHSCDIEDFDKLVINVNIGSGKNMNYEINLEFISSKKTYIFSPHNFSKMSVEDALIYMLKLKSVFNENEYEIKNADRLHFLMLQNDYTNNEKALIYKLFDQ